jgi:hypothetical protein
MGQAEDVRPRPELLNPDDIQRGPSRRVEVLLQLQEAFHYLPGSVLRRFPNLEKLQSRNLQPLRGGSTIHLAILHPAAGGAQTMAVPDLDQTMRDAFAGIDNEDVRLFYQYIEELKHEVRRRLSHKVKLFPGSSAIAQSALASMILDLIPQKIPLSEVDEYGYPMLWPLLLKYVERHCDKWKKYHQTKGRTGRVVSTEAVGDLADERARPEAETDFLCLCEGFVQQLDLLDQCILQGRLEDKTLAEIAAHCKCSDTTVSNRLKSIRRKLEVL